MVVVDFIPTSENISAWILKIVQKKMAKIDIKATAIEFWETPKSHCRVEI
jgi:6-pyruvoyltetrahydropterin/6-carboxytetrahydropterin synthase